MLRAESLNIYLPANCCSCCCCCLCIFSSVVFLFFFNCNNNNFAAAASELMIRKLCTFRARHFSLYFGARPNGPLSCRCGGNKWNLNFVTRLESGFLAGRAIDPCFVKRSIQEDPITGLIWRLIT